MMKYFILLSLLTIFAGCSFSGAPSGSSPKQVGSFYLVDGPKSALDDDTKVATFYSEYLEGGDKLSSQEIAEQSKMQKTILYQVAPYPSADEAQKSLREFKETKQLMLLPKDGDSITETGNKLVLNHRGGMETIVWVKDSTYYKVDSRVPGKAAQFVEKLPTK